MNYTFSLQVSHGFKTELITGGLNWSNPKYWSTLSLLKSKPKIHHLFSILDNKDVQLLFPMIA